jgi:hypothetical protein
MAKKTTLQHPSVSDLFVTMQAAAKEYGVGYQWLRAAAMFGVLPAEKAGATWLAAREDVERYVRKHKGKRHVAQQRRRREEGR